MVRPTMSDSYSVVFKPSMWEQSGADDRSSPSAFSLWVNDDFRIVHSGVGPGRARVLVRLTTRVAGGFTRCVDRTCLRASGAECCSFPARRVAAEFDEPRF